MLNTLFSEHLEVLTAELAKHIGCSTRDQSRSRRADLAGRPKHGKPMASFLRLLRDRESNRAAHLPGAVIGASGVRQPDEALA